MGYNGSWGTKKHSGLVHAALCALNPAQNNIMRSILKARLIQKLSSSTLSEGTSSQLEKIKKLSLMFLNKL